MKAWTRAMVSLPRDALHRNQPERADRFAWLGGDADLSLRDLISSSMESRSSAP